MLITNSELSALKNPIESGARESGLLKEWGYLSLLLELINLNVEEVSSIVGHFMFKIILAWAWSQDQ
jgi:hypothetical protein